MASPFRTHPTTYENRRVSKALITEEKVWTIAFKNAFLRFSELMRQPTKNIEIATNTKVELLKTRRSSSCSKMQLLRCPEPFRKYTRNSESATNVQGKDWGSIPVFRETLNLPRHGLWLEKETMDDRTLTIPLLTIPLLTLTITPW